MAALIRELQEELGSTHVQCLRRSLCQPQLMKKLPSDMPLFACRNGKASVARRKASPENGRAADLKS